jgi:hypothetical protein
MKTNTIGLTAIEKKLLKLREETRELTEEIESTTPSAPRFPWVALTLAFGIGAAVVAIAGGLI